MDYEDTITREEKKLIAQLRRRINHELPLTILSQADEDQDLYLVRWLRAREYNLENATTMLRNHFQWRKERKADFASGKSLHPFFQQSYPYTFPGLDKKGQPIVLIPLSKWDFRKLLNNPPRLKEFDDFVTQFFETIISKLHRENFLRKGSGKPPVTQVTFIIDAKDYPYAQLIRYEAIKKILQIMSVYEAHYPEILHHGIFLHCPSYFNIFVNMMKPVLSARTQSKMKYYSQSQLPKWKAEMVTLLDPDVLPEQYGGTSKT